jgi:hypothetical protein
VAVRSVRLSAVRLELPLSIAGLRYRSVLAIDGGPIESIEEGEFDLFGERYFQANAKLLANYLPKRVRQLYSDADGTGIHTSQMVARHIAISEALERWAYHASISSPGLERFGFHIDPSSNGMAAFPGLVAGSARKAAQIEAVERNCLLNWWEHRMDGKLRSTKWAHINAVSFDSPCGRIAVILFMRSDSGFYCYGHAAGVGFENACDHARLELARHECAINRWIESNSRQIPENTFERRSWFFSTEQGHATFQERLAAPARGQKPVSDLICDLEIKGPWSAYTTVWRYLLRPPSADFASNADRYFFW